MTINMTEEDAKRILEESKNWYGAIPKGFIHNKLKELFKGLMEGAK